MQVDYLPSLSIASCKARRSSTVCRVTTQILLLAIIARAWTKAPQRAVSSFSLVSPLLEQVEKASLSWLISNLAIGQSFFTGTACSQDISNVLGLLESLSYQFRQPLGPLIFAEAVSHLVQSGATTAHQRRLGAFYTPLWLVNYTLGTLHWPERPGSLIDPCCGAGAFLVGACLAARSHQPNLDPQSLACRIYGADIDPVAVLAARVGCFAAVCDRLDAEQTFEPRIDVANLFAEPARAPSDIVVGNPPWIRYCYLPDDAKQQVAQAARHYQLVPAVFHGGSQLDVAAVCAYRMLDIHLKLGGIAGLVLPSSLLRSPSAAAFRALRLAESSALRLWHITDFGSCKLFADANNLSSLLCFEKTDGSACSSALDIQPRDIHAQIVHTNQSPPTHASLQQALQILQPTETTATLVGKQHRVVFRPVTSHPLCPCICGETSYVRGRKGITTDLNGAYFVRVLGRSAPGLLRVVNDVTPPNQRSKKVPIHSFDVEESVVFPLLKGAQQIQPFRFASAYCAVVLPNRSLSLQQPSSSSNPRSSRLACSEVSFASEFPFAYAHFAWIDSLAPGLLANRSTHRRMGSKGLFFRVYNIGAYSFAPYKVVWAEIRRSFAAAICSQTSVFPGGPKRPIIADHKVYFAPFETLKEALFVCALLNSPNVRDYINASTHRLQVGALLDRIKLPKFSARNPDHIALCSWSHRAVINSEPPDSTILNNMERLARKILCTCGKVSNPV